MSSQQLKYYKDKLNYETDAADLAGYFSGGSADTDVVVIDTRSEDAYETEHIPGAVNIPHRTMNEESLQPLNKKSLYIVYCDGIGCNASTKGALRMTELGFRVKELLGGLDWWKRDGYSTQGKEGVKRNVHVHCAC